MSRLRVASPPEASNGSGRHLSTPLPPRLYGIVATQAPIAVIFQRGPGRRWGLYRWDLSSGDFEVGAGFTGTLYPRRCDLSPDGRLLYAFVLKGGKGEFVGQAGLKTYSAVSRAPWLYALAAWPESGTWTRGYHFVDARASGPEIGPALAGDAAPLRERYRLALRLSGAEQYAVERRRGWVEHASCPPRGPNDVWDERRSVVLSKVRPAGRRAQGLALVLSDRGALRQGGIEGRRPSYRLERLGRAIELDGVVWADWDPFGRLLVATRDARLQVRDADDAALPVLRERVLTTSPPLVRAPEWARSW